MATQSLSESRTTHSKVRDLTYIALMTALIAVCSWITIPTGGIEFTMQTFAIFAALLLLGGKRGTLAFVLYLCMGLIGLPVFAGFHAGPGVLLGATGGYLVGFLLGDLIYWFLTAKLGERLAVQVPAVLLGLLSLYTFGTAWFLLVYTGGGNAGTVTGALMMCVVPFIVPDVIKIFLAAVLAKRVRAVILKGDAQHGS